MFTREDKKRNARARSDPTDSSSLRAAILYANGLSSSNKLLYVFLSQCTPVARIRAPGKIDARSRFSVRVGEMLIAV